MDTIPLKATFDSLKTNLMDKLQPNEEEKNQESEPKFLSSHTLAQSIDENTRIDSLKGYKIKTAMHIYEDAKEVISIGFEIKEFYASSFDSTYFTIPKKYKLINKDK